MKKVLISMSLDVPTCFITAHIKVNCSRCWWGLSSLLP